MELGSPRSARAPSCSLPPDCSPAARRRRIGPTRTCSASASRTSSSTRTCCTSAATGCSRRPARQRASTCVSTWCAATGVPRLPTSSPGGWWWRRTATEGRHSSSRSRCRRATTPTPTCERCSRWVEGNLDRELNVDELARRAAMTTRTFARRFKQSTGTTPLQWVLHQRVAKAQRLLETTRLGVDEIAAIVRLRLGRRAASALRPPRRIDTERLSVQLQSGGLSAILEGAGDVAQLARAPALQAGSRGFESHRLHREPQVRVDRRSGSQA